MIGRAERARCIKRWPPERVLPFALMKRRPQPPSFVAPLAPCNLPLRRCPVVREDASHRILIMRVGAHGDILMGTPLLAALRRAYPNAHLTWIAEHTEMQAIDAHPFIDEVLGWDGGYWKRMLRRGFYPLWLARALRFRRELRRRRYDIFVSFQPEEWPLLMQAVGAPVTVGIFDTFRRYYRAARSSRYVRLYRHAYAFPHLPDHRIDQYLLTLDALGLPPAASKRMTMGYTAEDDAAVTAFLEQSGIGARERLIVLAPMTTWPTKCWPPDRYVALGDALARAHDCRIVLIGSAKEKDAVQSIASAMTCSPLMAAGALSFRQMAALLARASLVACGDTGPMHVAAAVGTPYVAIFGATGAHWYGPLDSVGRHLFHAVPCGPCDQKICPNTGDDYLRCLKGVTVDAVLEAATGLLEQPRQKEQAQEEAYARG